MSKFRIVRMPATLEELQRGVYFGISGNSMQRRQHVRRLRRLGVYVEHGRRGQYYAQYTPPLPNAIGA